MQRFHTLKRWLKICLLGIFLVSHITGISYLEIWGEKEVKDKDLFAKAACLMDGESGQILFGKNENTPLANASTTKILTCIIALEKGDLNQIITVSERAAKAPKVHLGTKAGQKFVLQDLLYALMLESFNDAAIMIAEGVAGTVEKFAEMMNQKATAIGCRDTYFITPNGLDGEDSFGKHHTTAEDLALMMRYCIDISDKSALFLEITGTSSYSFWDTDNRQLYNCSNHNTFLGMMEGAISGKTGFTGDAGYCYVGAVKRDGKCLIVSLLACGWPNNKTYKWSDTRKLMTYGLENFEKREVFQKGLIDEPIQVEMGQYKEKLFKGSSKVNLVYDKEMEKASMLIRKGEKIRCDISLPNKLYAPVKAGEKVGYISYYNQNTLLATYPVFAKTYIPCIDYDWCLKKLFSCFFTGV